jgi:hypothetical protein
MYTSIGLAALAGLFLSAPVAETPTWRLSYDQARHEGRRDGKPLAVVIGSGKKGFEGLSTQGKLSKQVRNLLANHYIPVYVDASTAAGGKLAAEFAIAEKGLVISDRSGQFQAFFHTGTLDDDLLTSQLRRFMNPPLIAQATERLGSTQVSYYPPGDESSYQQAVPRQTYIPSYYSGGFGGGCRS